MRLVIARGARRDLNEIGDHIARDSPDNAVTFVSDLQGACRGLLDAPEAWPIVSGFERTGLRRRPYGSYLIFYVPQPDRVVVVRVLHGARNLGPILAESVPR